MFTGIIDRSCRVSALIPQPGGVRIQLEGGAATQVDDTLVLMWQGTHYITIANSGVAV